MRAQAEARGRVPSKAELAAVEASRREAAVSTSTIDASNKGYKMMAKLGYKPGSALGRQGPGGGEGDEPDQRLREPLWVPAKEDRGGIGLDSAKKRKLREAAEGESRRVKAAESEYVERVRAEREARRQEGQFSAAQRVIERLDSEKEAEGVARGDGMRGDRPKARANLLYRGLVRDREAALREKQAAGRRYEALSAGDECLMYSERDPRLPRTAEGEVVEVDAEDGEEDEELAAFDALGAQERLSRAVEYLRDVHHYCFWCKHRYGSAAMEGCPGLTEADHD